jgi:hypothetical protein
MGTLEQFDFLKEENQKNSINYQMKIRKNLLRNKCRKEIK